MKFLLDGDGNLINNLDGNEIEIKHHILDENVEIFDYTKDEKQAIHLIYLQKNGTLNYIVFKDGKLSESVIGKFDIETNYYNQISILVVNDKINIFYSYSNIINSNIYTLHHVIFSPLGQEKFPIIRYVSKKVDLSFSVDSDTSGNIHLFYNTLSDNFSYIFYTYFNPYKKRWLTNPVKLSSSDKSCKYPFVFVDLHNNVHGSWWEKNSNMYILKYNRMSSVGRDMYKWNEINIPIIIQEKPESLIYEDNNNLIIECNDYRLLSSDFGMNWIKEEKSISIFPVIKPNESFMSDPPIDKSDFFDNKENNNLENSVPNSIAEDLGSEIEKMEMHNISQSLNEILSNQNEIRIILSNIIQEQTIINQKITILEDSYKKTKTGFKKYFSI